MGDPRTALIELFPNKSHDIIDSIISIVEESSSESDGIKFDTMVDLLSHTGTLHQADIRNQIDDSAFVEILEEQDGLLDEAAGYNIEQIYDDIDNFDKIEDVTTMLLEMFPDADPSYLRAKANELGDEQLLQQFIENAFETKDYPTREDYIKRENIIKEEREKKRQRMQYTEHFHLYEFLKEHPNATEQFLDPKRKHALADQTDKESDVINKEEQYAIDFLCDRFCYQRKSDILKMFDLFKKDIVRTSMKLKKMPMAFKNPRALVLNENDIASNVLLLKEIAFVRYQDEIERAIRIKQENIEKARELGVLETCCICFFDELVPEECFVCNKGCIFCKDCIRNGIMVVIADAKTDMGCVNECDGDYSLATLQMVLDPKTFTHFCQKKQLAEIEKAQVEGVEFCCLCYKFAAIPDPSDKIFHCEACGKDSCRECKHESHIPLRCREIEYDEDVKMRTFIENKMTEALIRKCYNCNKQFLKSSGCNKITCGCGAKMCYLCGGRNVEYDHFSETKCPLFTDDNLIHINNVRAGAANAKKELGVDKNPELLKFDPSVNI